MLLYELRRKAIHITGSFIAIGYYFISKEAALVLLSFLNVLFLIIEYLRLKAIISFPETLLRPHENKKVAGYIYFTIAALLCILVFDKAIAIASLLMLAIGDAVSGIAGAMMNVNARYSLPRTKPLPIITVMFSVCIIIGVLLNMYENLSLDIYIAGAIGATLGDAVPIRIREKTVDDNLVIPITAGSFMSVFKTIFH